MTTIGFVGAGQMAQALAGGIAATNDDLSFIVADPSGSAIDKFQQKVAGRCKTVEMNHEVFAEADVVFIAVKPQFFKVAIVTHLIEGSILNRPHPPLVVSVMAGIDIESIQQQTSISSVIRVMPNTPCLVGAGACGMSNSEEVTPAQIELVEGFLSTTGIVVPVVEGLLDAVTGLSGSGPAYVFELIDALALGGVKCGLSRDVADRLAAQTVFGAAKLAIESGEHPSVLRDRVTSPGGTTIAGLKALFDSGFQQAAIAAVEAASNRSKELG